MDEKFSLDFLDNKLTSLNSTSEKLDCFYHFYLKIYYNPLQNFKEEQYIEYITEKEKIISNYNNEKEKINSKKHFEQKLENIKIKYLDEPLMVLDYEYGEREFKKELELNLLFFGNNEAFKTMFPNSLFHKHIIDFESNTEFNYWWLNYQSNKALENYKKNKGINFNSPKVILYLKAQLIEILNFEKNVDKLILEFNLNVKSRNSDFLIEIEYLKLIDDYYKYNIWNYNLDTLSSNVKYILFKEYLEKEIHRLESKINVKKEAIKANLDCKFDKNFLDSLFNQLISGDNPFFASNTDKNSFLYAFGAIDSIEKFIPLVWVKTQVQKKTKEVSIRSFVDLLDLLGIDFRNSGNKKIIEILFRKKNKSGAINPMKLQPKHFETAPKTYVRKTSEFYYDLHSIVNSCKKNN